MDQRERMNDPEEAVRLQVRAQLLSMQTAMPVIVESFDPARMVASAKPCIRAFIPPALAVMKPAIPGIYTDATGNTWAPLPLLINMPVVFPGGGGWTLTFPVKPGDEALAVFSSRSIDRWWQAGGVQNQIELRIFDLSDGFLMVGPRSQPRVLEDINTDGPELRSDDGATSIALGPLGAVTINAPLPGGVVINGNLHVFGVITHTP